MICDRRGKGVYIAECERVDNDRRIIGDRKVGRDVPWLYAPQCRSAGKMLDIDAKAVVG